ncbi:hypothetical protein CMETHOX_02040 [Lacrimispora indolis]|uniref:Stage 0 sporulation protein A homolog n=1 Tax=Eubacterium limosum TaxID=1736 RepID=A0A6N3GQT5_EUBLI|nr:hypothetical protein CMETHOX_02040 [[Clostridium] methoxybenzovorans]
MKTIFVDDEVMAHVKFKNYAVRMGIYDQCALFYDPKEALEYTGEHSVDLAVLDIEMPGIGGIELGRQLKQVDRNIRLIYTTGYGEYALDAFGVDAIGYLVKPYGYAELQKELEKAIRTQKVRENKVYIQTMPRFEVFIDDMPLEFSRKKVKELLAVMIDRRGAPLTTGDAIAALWENRPEDQKTKNLFRTTLKRLYDFLEEKKIRFILLEDPALKAVNASAFRCDYYELMEGAEDKIKKYSGFYMEEYAWAEDTNASIQNFLEKI